MNKIAAWILILTIAVCTACSSRGSGYAVKPVSAYDRVNNSGVLRCAYIIYPPYCMKDPNTGHFTGVFVDTIEAAAQKLGWKVLWTEEVGYGTLFEGLHANRFDLFAGGLWPNAQRAKSAKFTIPILYNVVKVYGRSQEKRFQNLNEINSPSVTISVLDGAMESLIAKEQFPLAKTLSLPQLSDFSQVLLNIKTKKADLTFAEPGIVALFLKSNPGALKELAGGKPVRVFGNCYAMNPDESRLQDVLNTTLAELINSGRIEAILKKYETAPDTLYRVALPYQMRDAH